MSGHFWGDWSQSEKQYQINLPLVYARSLLKGDKFPFLFFFSQIVLNKKKPVINKIYGGIVKIQNQHLGI